MLFGGTIFKNFLKIQQRRLTCVWDFTMLPDHASWHNKLDILKIILDFCDDSKISFCLFVGRYTLTSRKSMLFLVGREFTVNNSPHRMIRCWNVFRVVLLCILFHVRSYYLTFAKRLFFAIWGIDPSLYNLIK